MKVNTIKSRLTKSEQGQLDRLVQNEVKRLTADAVAIATENIFLQTIYLFFDVYGFRAKRLNRLCQQLMAQKIELDKLYEEQLMAAVMIERMKACGADFTPTFRELLENEEQRFKQMTDKEYGKRCAGK